MPQRRSISKPLLGLALALGTPVADATTKVQIPSAGTWHVRCSRGSTCR